MKININKKYVIMLSLILLIIVSLVVLNTTGVLKKIGKSTEQITETEAQGKLEQALQTASTQKETDANYNSSDYLTGLLQEQNIIVMENIVAIDGYNFEIDRENLVVTQSLGKSEVTVNSELVEVLGKNDNGKYRAKVQVTVTSNIPIDNIIFQNENGTYSKEKINELTYTKEAEVELNKEYIITVITKDGRVNDLKRTIATTDTADSLLNAVEHTILETGYYNIMVNDELYSIHAYVYDGDMAFSEDQTFGDDNDVATASEYAKNMVVVKVNGDLTIDSGKTITAHSTSYGGPKGMLIYTTGNLTNNGIITMTAKGAKAIGQNIYLWKNEYTSNSEYEYEYEYVPAVGATGGASVRTTTANSGNPGVGRQTGGGGSGSAYDEDCVSGRGGKGTSYSGGTGGGASRYGYATSGNDYGGAGGNGAGTTYGGYGAGGTGNPAGNNGIMNGTGGLLIIFGNSITNNGTISASGVYGYSTKSTYGGSSGGGSINIFYKNYIYKGLTEVNGGKNSSVSYKYGQGGAGTVSCGSIATGTYVEYTE